MKVRHKLRALCLTLLVLFLLVSGIDRSIDLPLMPSARAQASEWLDCTAHDSTWVAWKKTGASPYLDAQDEPNNYIESNTPGAQEGWFDFADTTIADGTVKANISIYCWDADGSDWAEVYVDYTGTGSGAYLGDVALHTAKQYETIDLGTHTVSEINNLRVYFVYQKTGGATYVYIDHVRIGVRSAIDTVDADGPYNVGQSISVTWTNYDGFGTGEDYLLVEYYDQDLSQSLEIHNVGLSATSDSYGPIGASQAGHTIEVYVYTASGATDDHTQAITQGNPWPDTCYVNPGVPEFPVGVTLLLPVTLAVYFTMRRRSASHTMDGIDRLLMC